jgi:AraC-like DNA-binding protein
VLICDDQPMLSARTVFSSDGVTIADFACRHPAGKGHETEAAPGHAVVFVRRGCFVRSVDGVESFLDPTVAYCMNPGQEQRYDHPHDHGDDCTTLFLDEGVVASLRGGETSLPAGPLPVSPQLDLGHRLLLAAAGGDDRHETQERALELLAGALASSDPAPVLAGRPATASARRALADEAREALLEDPDRSLPELAAALAVSPHHLSRVFRSATGETVSRHRMRLRTRAALERLSGGERDLARLSAELGFADQSHLCRVVRDETGHAPSALREALA